MTTFATQIADFAKKTEDLTDRVVRQVVMEIGTRIVNRSPVGDGTLWLEPPPKNYVGGRFRANWQYGNYSGAGIPMGELPDIDPSEAESNVSTARILDALPKKAAGMRHILINNLPYAMVLERGRQQGPPISGSTQAPQGMVGLTMLEVPQIVEDVVASEKGK